MKTSIDSKLEELDQIAENYSLDEKDKRTQLKSKVDALLKLLDSSNDTSDVKKGVSLYWRGRALAYLLEDGDEDAVNYLSKAVKLEPSLIEAWNALASCFWKKKEYSIAQNCLEEALNQKKNKDSLNELSMILRSVEAKDDAEKKANVERSVQLSRESVALDMKDGKSWYVLGNAYLLKFFTCTPELEILDKALKAYQQAESATIRCAATNPDLYFNRGNVCRFLEDYEQAVANYEKAKSLDPSLPGAEEIDAIRRYVSKVSKLVLTKNGLKSKKVEELIKKLPSTDQFQDRKRIELSDLKPGKYEKRVVMGVVMAPITRQDSVIVSFMILNSKGVAYVVSLYNVSSELLQKIKGGDIIYILDPVIKHVSLSSNGSYLCVQTSNPTHLYINKRPITSSDVLFPQAKVQHF